KSNEVRIISVYDGTLNIGRLCTKFCYFITLAILVIWFIIIRIFGDRVAGLLPAEFSIARDLRRLLGRPCRMPMKSPNLLFSAPLGRGLGGFRPPAANYLPNAVTKDAPPCSQYGY